MSSAAAGAAGALTLEQPTRPRRLLQRLVRLLERYQNRHQGRGRTG